MHQPGLCIGSEESEDSSQGTRQVDMLPMNHIIMDIISHKSNYAQTWKCMGFVRV